MKYPTSGNFFAEADKMRSHLGGNNVFNESAYNNLLNQLNETHDQNIHALLTYEEGKHFLTTLRGRYPFPLPTQSLFSYTDPVAPFAGSIKDALAFSKLLMEIRSTGISATEYFGKDGKRYIKLSGYAGVRRYLTASRYLASNVKILDMGIGTQGIQNGIISGARFCLVFSAAYRAVELLLKDEYGLTAFFVNLTMDVAKIVVSVAIVTAAKILITGTTAVGGSVIIVAGGIFAVGVLTTVILTALDNEYGISEAIIKKLKSFNARATDRGITTPYGADQFFSDWGRYSRG